VIVNIRLTQQSKNKLIPIKLIKSHIESQLGKEVEMLTVQDTMQENDEKVRGISTNNSIQVDDTRKNNLSMPKVIHELFEILEVITIAIVFRLALDTSIDSMCKFTH
jgi:hypothetical protein